MKGELHSYGIQRAIRSVAKLEVLSFCVDVDEKVEESLAKNTKNFW